MNPATRLVPITAIVVIFLVAFATPLSYELDQASLRIAIFLIGMLGWVIIFRAGWATADKDATVIRRDAGGGTDTIKAKETYLYVPGFHAIEAVLPNYLIKHEFPIDAIDTRTAGLQRIDQIKVRVVYRIVDPKTCYNLAALRVERIKEIEEGSKLKRSDVGLWKQLINEAMKSLVDDAVRLGVWTWADQLREHPELTLEVPFKLAPNTEYDPYALSLNRVKLAEKIKEQIELAADAWGIVVEQLFFETIKVDEAIVKNKLRNKDRELDEARHQAAMQAAATRIRGEAEAEIRARTVARVIEVLLSQKGLDLSNDVIYNVVRAAMYSDGQMIWGGTMEKPAPPSGTAKTA